MRGTPWVAILAGLALLAPGCAEKPPDQASTFDPNPLGDQDTAALAAPVAEFQHLADVNQTYTNPFPPSNPSEGSHEWTVVEIEVPDGYGNATFAFTRSHVSVDVFAPGCRVYRDGDLEDQEAFSDAGVGQVASNGECTLEFKDLDPGTYRAVYLVDGLQPGGTHDVRVRITAWSTPTWDNTEGRAPGT